jgi:hypothetical protein
MTYRTSLMYDYGDKVKVVENVMAKNGMNLRGQHGVVLTFDEYYITVQIGWNSHDFLPFELEHIGD